jgi:hypothetical protein
VEFCAEHGITIEPEQCPATIECLGLNSTAPWHLLDSRRAFCLSYDILWTANGIAGFDRVICRTTRKSYNIRTAASFC